MSRNREFENPEDQPQDHRPGSDDHLWEKYLPESDADFPAEGSELDAQASEQEFCSGNIDSLVWERLIDSQLPEGQYEELLLSMEQQPELYRDCAMAFLERQAWTEAMQEMGLKSSADPMPLSRDAAFQPPEDDSIADGSSTATSSLARSNDHSGEDNRTQDARSADVRSRDVRTQDNLNKAAWLKSSIVWIPSSIAIVALLTISLPWLRQSPTDSQGIDPAPRVRLADFNNDGIDSYVQSVNQLSVDQKNHILRNKPSHGVSATVPTTPAVLRQRPIESSRQFLIMRDGVGNCFVLPVDSYKSEPLVVQ